MNLIDLLILSVALGVDCLVVSFSQGLIFKQNKRRNSFFLALTMGIFQGGMPCLSYAGMNFVEHYVQPYGSWLVFTIFMCLGFKFVIEAFYDKEEEITCIGLKCLLGMGLATSIDALASGVSLKLTDTSILSAALMIGLGSFIMSGLGFWSGCFLKRLPSKMLGIFGGLILIFLAIKSVI